MSLVDKHTITDKIIRVVIILIIIATTPRTIITTDADGIQQHSIVPQMGNAERPSVYLSLLK